MARTPTTKHPKSLEPARQSQGKSEPPPLEPAPKAAPKPAAKREVVSKSEAIRHALAAGFGGPQEGTAYIRKEFAIELTPSHFSAVKATGKKKGGTASKGKPGRKPRQPVDGFIAPPAKRRTNGEADLIESLETLKPLIAQYGPDKMKRLVDLLG